MTVNHHHSGPPLWAKLLIGFVLLKLLLGTGLFTLLFLGAIIWFACSAMGRCFGSRYYDDASRYEKRKRDMDYGNGKAKREDISIV